LQLIERLSGSGEIFELREVFALALQLKETVIRLIVLNPRGAILRTCSATCSFDWTR
jgi:hypothetical protein